MGHNVSAQKAAGYVRAQLLAGYADWQMILTCDHCRRETRLAVQTIEDRWPGRSVSKALGRFRCCQCRRAPGRVVIELGRRQVVLAGPGSY